MDTSLAVKERIYSIDLLRIVAMFFVCILHILNNGGVLRHTIAESSQFYISSLMNIAAFVAVDCYALISGYVGVLSNHKYRNLIRLWLQVVFYNLGITLLFYISGNASVSVARLCRTIFPISTDAYWYFTAYFLMFPIIPGMNHLILTMDKAELKKMLLFFFVVFSLFSCLPMFARITGIIAQGYHFIWLVYLYMLGGTIRVNGFSFLCTPKCIPWLKKDSLEPKNRVVFLLLYGICILLTFILTIKCHPIVLTHLGYDPFFERLVSYNSPTIVLASIFLFEFFEQLKISTGISIIRFLSPLTFGVYLIHVQALIWSIFISDNFKWIAELSAFLLPLAVVLCAVGIYLICSVIDYLRWKLFRLLRI